MPSFPLKNMMYSNLHNIDTNLCVINTVSWLYTYRWCPGQNSSWMPLPVFQWWARNMASGPWEQGISLCLSGKSNPSCYLRNSENIHSLSLDVHNFKEAVCHKQWALNFDGLDKGQGWWVPEVSWASSLWSQASTLQAHWADSSASSTNSRNHKKSIKTYQLIDLILFRKHKRQTCNSLNSLAPRSGRLLSPAKIIPARDNHK